MKIRATKTIRFGSRRFEEGEEFDVPEKLARNLVSAGIAEVPEDKPKKTYKTRQVKAEDDT